ncbi:hypothetical protein K502DRAFT_352201 [Neoconidiobolus thromboides FSU 785]|nr:hypothetical protein K502DRAFT_352201 [Neoconidiobolus thromboides FSU 785]
MEVETNKIKKEVNKIKTAPIRVKPDNQNKQNGNNVKMNLNSVKSNRNNQKGSKKNVNFKNRTINNNPMLRLSNNQKKQKGDKAQMNPISTKPNNQSNQNNQKSIKKDAIFNSKTVKNNKPTPQLLEERLSAKKKAHENLKKKALESRKKKTEKLKPKLKRQKYNKKRVNMEQKILAARYNYSQYQISLTNYRFYDFNQSLLAHAGNYPENLYLLSNVDDLQTLKNRSSEFEAYYKMKGSRYYYTRFGYYNGEVWNSTKRCFMDENIKGFLPVNNLKVKDVIYQVPVKANDINGLEFTSWAFEHLMDTSSILDASKSTILRGLYVVEDSEAILSANPSFIKFIHQLETRNETVIIILPNDDNEKNDTPLVNQLINNYEKIEYQSDKAIELYQKEYRQHGHEEEYIEDGVKMIWLKKFRGIIRYYEMEYFKKQNYSKILCPYYIIKLILQFIKITSNQTDKEMIVSLQGIIKDSLSVLKNSTTPNDKTEMSKMLIYQLTPILFFHRKQSNRSAKAYLIKHQHYVEFLDSFKALNIPISIVCPKSMLHFTIYSDGSAWEYTNSKEYEKFQRNLEGGDAGTFSGALVSSTQHIITSWRYRIERIVRDSNGTELYGLLFALLVVKQMKVPMCIRSDNLYVLKVIDGLIKQGLEHPYVKQWIKIDYKVKQFFKAIVEMPEIHEIQLEWIRSHTSFAANVVVDRFTKLAYFTADIVHFDRFMRESKKVAGEVKEKVC